MRRTFAEKKPAAKKEAQAPGPSRTGAPAEPGALPGDVSRAVAWSVQRKAAPGGAATPPDGGGAAGPADPREVQARLGPGAPMAGDTRSRMERAFSTSFAAVRVHTDAGAARVAGGLDARAVTVGRDVAFASGEYRPGSPEGDALLAHELAHTVQQRGAATTSASTGFGPAPLEAEANRSAAGVVGALWGAPGMAGQEGALLPRQGMGLRLQRCTRGDHGTAPPGSASAAAPAPAAPAITMPPEPADRAIVEQVERLEAQRHLFLSGRLQADSAVYSAIQARLNAKIAELNALGPPVALRGISRLRLFGARSALEGGGTPQSQIVFEKFFRTGSRVAGWDTLPQQYSGARGRTRWLALPPADRLRIILEYSAVPGASRHHWGTEVDFNSTTVAEWEHGGRLERLGAWLHANAGRVGFVQSFTPRPAAGTPGRTGGHAAEAWHWSYAPLATAFRQMWLRDVNLTTDFVDPLMADWRTRMDDWNSANPTQAVSFPADLREALTRLNVRDYVNQIGPGL